MPLLLHLLLLLLLHSAYSAPPQTSGFRSDLTHIDAAGGFTKRELLRRAVHRSNLRSHSLRNHHISDIHVPVHSSEGEYTLDLRIGSSPGQLDFSAILDTGSDLIWTQCVPCQKCQPQPTPLFNPSNSPTFKKVPCSHPLCKAVPSSNNCTTTCNYDYNYLDGTSSKGFLGSDQLTFTNLGKLKVAKVNAVVGCGTYNDGDIFNSSGIVGFGAGPLSLISQLGIGKFSYCFTPFGSTTKSPIFFGKQAVLAGAPNIQIASTRMIKNPLDTTPYYVDLQGITVGSTRIPVPSSVFAVRKDGTGGVVLDSGTAVTRFDTPVYNLIEKSLLSQVKLARNTTGAVFDLCFVLPAGKTLATVRNIPKMIFHFHPGPDLVLRRENYLIEGVEDGQLCFTMKAMEGSNIIGNLQQQNVQVLYDLDNQIISFARAQCDKL